MTKKEKIKNIILLIALVLLFSWYIIILNEMNRSTLSKEEPITSDIIVDGIVYESNSTIDMPENILFNKYAQAKESTVTIKATVLPSYATNKKLSWSLVWADGKSHGTTSDYVTITPSSDTLSCTLKCTSIFNYQLKLVVNSQQNANKTASCTLDYAYTITGIDEDEIYMWNECESTCFYLTDCDCNSNGWYGFQLGNYLYYDSSCCSSSELALFDVSNALIWQGTKGNKLYDLNVYYEFKSNGDDFGDELVIHNGIVKLSDLVGKDMYLEDDERLEWITGYTNGALNITFDIDESDFYGCWEVCYYGGIE